MRSICSRFGSLVWAFFLVSVFLCPKTAKTTIVDLRYLGVVYNNYSLVGNGSRHPLIYPETPKEALNLNMTLDLFRVMYFDSTIESVTTEAQYRGVGLQLGLGARITEKLWLGYWHHSQHLLERENTLVVPFPVEDALQIKLHIFKSREKEDSFL